MSNRTEFPEGKTYCPVCYQSGETKNGIFSYTIDNECLLCKGTGEVDVDVEITGRPSTSESESESESESDPTPPPPQKPEKISVFPDFIIRVFSDSALSIDTEGNPSRQIPELQLNLLCLWAAYAEARGYNVEGMVAETPSGKWKFTRKRNGGGGDGGGKGVWQMKAQIDLKNIIPVGALPRGGRK